MKQPTHIKDGNIYSGNNYIYNGNEMQGCSGSIAGVSGLVPAPAAGDENKALIGDGNWTNVVKTEVVAPVEDSSVSSHDYAIGEQFVYGGVLCKAKTAISIGDSFTIDTNYEFADDITTQIKAIVDSYVTGVKGNAENVYRKGNVSLTLENISADPLEIAHGGTGSTTKNFVDLSNSQTVGGAKTFSNSNIFIKNTNVTKGTDPSSNKYWGIYCVDSQGNEQTNRLGILETTYFTNGEVMTGLRAYLDEAGSTANNLLGVGITKTGGKYVLAQSAITIDLSGTTQTADTAYSVLTFKYKNPQSQTKTVNVIRTYGDSETAANNGIAIIGSSSGATVVSAGESAPTVIKNQALSNNENIYMIADGSVVVMTNAGTAASVVQVASFNTDGTMSLGKPLGIGSGGTGATTAQLAKANLSLGTSAQNFYISNPNASNQSLWLRWKDSNSSSSLNGKNLILVISTTGISLWNNTDSKTEWGLNYPVGIAQGGTGATTRLLAGKSLCNSSVGTSATHFVTFKSDWSQFGYSSIGNVQSLLGLGGAAYRPVATSVSSGSTGLLTSGGAYSALYEAIHDYGASWTTSYSVTISETGSNAILFFNNLIISIWFYKNASGYMNACVPGSYSDGGGASSTITLTRSTSGTVDTNTVKNGGNNWFYFTYNFSSGAFTAKRSNGSSATFHLIVFPKSK